MKKHEIIALCITLLFYLSVFLISLNKTTNNVHTNYTSINISLETVEHTGEKTTTDKFIEDEALSQHKEVKLPQLDNLISSPQLYETIDTLQLDNLESPPQLDGTIATQQLDNLESPTQFVEISVPNSSYIGNQDNQVELPTIRQVIQKEIQKNLEYPEIARKRNIQGNITIKITISSNGELISFHIVKSSGSSILDNSAEKLINKIFPLPTNNFLRENENITENITITYRLTSNS